MPAFGLNPGGWRTLRVTSILFPLLVLILAWGFTLKRLNTDEAEALAAARAQQSNLAIIVAENLAQMLDSARTLAAAAQDWWHNPPLTVAARLDAMRSANPAFLRVSLFNHQGKRVYSSSNRPPDPDITRAVAQALQDTPLMRPGQMFMPPNSGNPERSWYQPLLLPVGRAGEPPLGMLMIMLDLGHLLKLYRNIEFGKTGVIHILTARGRELLEWRPEGLVLDPEPHQLPPLADLPHSDGSFTTEIFNDGQAYLASYSKVDRFPLVMVVSRSVEDILQPVTEARTQALIILSLLTVLVAAASWLVGRSIHRNGKLFMALEDSSRRNRELIARLEDEKGRAYLLAAHDHLTGLPNRRTLKERATSHLAAAKRHRTHSVLLYLDLDRFKIINDTLGHQVGDALLQTVAARIQGAVRENDLVGRIGGDEFAVLLTGLRSIDKLGNIASKIIREVSQPFQTPDGQELQVSPSIGIAVYPRDGLDFDTLSRHADAAMSQAKRMGRATFAFYDHALGVTTERSFLLQQRLPKAIAENELILHYQPKVRLSDCQIVGFEALVRWQHPEFGLIYPGEFIPMAEDSSLIVELGAWVARTACAQLAQWCEAGLPCQPIAINLSALQLQQPTLPGFLDSLLAEYSLSPQMLQVEVTETVLLESLETAGKILERIKALGIKIALDDFGSGFSSLGYVRNLPIHALKIDRQFISDIRTPNDAVVTSFIIALAHNLKLQVVAEGVETPEQLQYLQSAGCDEAQGYYFSRPVPAEAVAQLLRKGILAPPIPSS